MSERLVSVSYELTSDLHWEEGSYWPQHCPRKQRRRARRRAIALSLRRQR